MKGSEQPEPKEPEKPQEISRRGFLLGAAAGTAVGVAGGGVLGAVSGFGNGMRVAAEVAPEVMVDVASRELGERTAELGEFWDSVKPLILKMIGQTGDFLTAIKAKGSSWTEVRSGLGTLLTGFKNDAVDWINTGDTSLDKTVEEISHTVEGDPVLGPKWRAILLTYSELQLKQEEFKDLSVRLTTVSEADKAVLKEDVKREMKEAIRKEFPWATSDPVSEFPER